MKALNFDKVMASVINDTLELDSIIEGIAYYLPPSDNQYIIAVDVDNRLACSTGFYEMDDFYYQPISGKLYPSEYRVVNSNGILMMAFEAGL